ncbi:hypothetical protein BD289DRAFT_447341 [Coniella lustricola]|uniref:Uncharacterized protein n=1 Tax=Coniella lustricola TaxID=2025994 RepID=A0A2T2ZT80_9PEZI|nr:hypothetical protein BD289DRAFT_447341 [Coniella lustricola]
MSYPQCRRLLFHSCFAAVCCVHGIWQINSTLMTNLRFIVDFPSAYNDSVSSVDTGGPQCDFFTGDNCTGDDWSTNGTQYLIPGEYNDAFSSVACMVD